MTFVLIALIFSSAAGLVLVWVSVRPLISNSQQNQQLSSEIVSSQESSVEEEISGNYFFLTVVNRSNPVPEGFFVNPVTFDGVVVNGSMQEDLSQMMEDAKSAGLNLTITQGYIGKEEQEELYWQKVEELKAQGMTPVKAESEAQNYIERGGYSEFQTGLALIFQSGDGEISFEQSKEYQWLIVHGVDYGFVLRYPANKENITNVSFRADQFRYVGKENAKKMRELAMCLEEYSQYIEEQSKNISNS